MMHKTQLRVLFSVLLCLVLPLAASGCGDSRGTYRTKDTKGGLAASSDANRPHGYIGDVLAGVPGVSMEEALAAMKRPVVLPPESVVGKPTKIVVDPLAVAEGRDPGLVIRYDSGIELNVVPGEQDLAALAQPVALGPDGNPAPAPRRRSDISLETVAGRATLVNRGGTAKGIGDRVTGIRPTVAWNMDGYLYSAKANGAALTVDDVLAVAEAIQN